MAVRRAATVVLILSVVAGIAGGYCALHLYLDGRLPGQFSLPWQRMEGLLESQVIAGTAIDAAVYPHEGRIEGEATLSVTHPGGDGSQVVLLLNPGLAVSAVACDGIAVRWRREEERLVVQLPPETTACTLNVSYAGVMRPMNAALLAYSPEGFVADRLQCWYPLDLKSFGEFNAALRLPEGQEVVWSGSLIEDTVADGVRTVHWKENRPVLAAGLAIGRFQKVSRVHGIVRCNVYGTAVDPDEAESWLAALGDSYNFLHSMLGPDQFERLNLVVTDQVSGISRIGGPTIVCSPEELQDPETLFVVLARQVAQNWWGDTVSGRWFSSRPEAGEWLMTGMAEYCAWQALRSVKGRRDYLRHMEGQYFPPELTVPMKTFNLDRRLRPGEAHDERMVRVRGAYVAATIAAYTGPDAFERACRNFMAVHRYTTVSYAALLHEFTLAAEKPLDELVRVWFDRPGTFDYAVADVSVDGARVHVTVENKGDIPAYVPIELGLVTRDSYQVHPVTPGVHGDSFSFSVDGPLQRVVLDPEFALGDMRRANNAWPPTQWPLGLDVSRNGRIAMLSQTEWGKGGGRRVYVFSLVDKSPEYSLRARAGGGLGFCWDPDGQQLAIEADPAGVWRDRTWYSGGEGAAFVGWRGAAPLFWNAGAIAAPAATLPKPPVPLPRPATGLAAVHPESGAIAYITETGLLALWDPARHELLPIRHDVRPAEDLQWRGDSGAIVYFDESGGFMSLDTATGEAQTLLRRNYRITHSAISARGTHVAWVDPAGLLRAFTPGGGEPVYISLPGEIVDFAWEGEDALVAIVATIPRRLPMRFHADHSLWRVPVSTWQGVRLPYDPVQFAETSSSVESYRLDTDGYGAGGGA